MSGSNRIQVYLSTSTCYTMKILIILLNVAFILGASCKKGEKLTPETQTGANTFSCKINGEIFKPKAGDFVEGLTVNLYNNIDLVILVTGTQYNPVKELLISFKDIPLEGTYLLNFNQSKYATYKLLNTPAQFHSKTLNSGKVVITRLDRNQRIISGRFDFQLTNESNSGETLNITEGRFDVKY